MKIAQLFWTLVCALMITVSAGCGAPHSRGSTAKTEKGMKYSIDAQCHPAYNTLNGDHPPTDSELTAALAGAQAIWHEDDAKDGKKDFAVAIEFEYVAPIGQFSTEYWEPKYNVIAETADLDALMKAPEEHVGAWILCVRRTPGNYARGWMGYARIVVPERWNKDPGAYAHELGHNASLGERPGQNYPVPGESVIPTPIMQSEQGAPGEASMGQLVEGRKYCNEKEKKAMETYQMRNPWAPYGPK